MAQHYIINNGVRRIMTPEEEAEYLASTQTQPAEQTLESRVDDLDNRVTRLEEVESV